jgi:RNA polymerase sigma-70 factor (ECF subfamily)
VSKELPQAAESDQLRKMATLWVRAQPAISSYLLSVVHDFHHAEDLLQEVAEVVALKFGEYDSDRPFVAWALGIAKIRVLKYFRQVSRDRLVFCESTLDGLAEAFQRVDVETEHDSARIALRECVKRVEGRRRQVLEMRYQSELSVVTIAKRLGISSNAVSMMLHRIRTMLAECVQRQLVSEEHPQ